MDLLESVVNKRFVKVAEHYKSLQDKSIVDKIFSVFLDITNGLIYCEFTFYIEGIVIEHGCFEVSRRGNKKWTRYFPNPIPDLDLYIKYQECYVLHGTVLDLTGFHVKINSANSSET